MVLLSSNWGVDPLHDGAVFPTPVALAQGEILFRDIQNQYGLIQSVIESLPISIFGPYLIVERITGSLIVIMVSCLIFLACKKITTREKSLKFSIIYLALIPSWNYSVMENWPVGGGPWPNIYGVLFQLIFIYSYLRYRKEKKSILIYYAGISLAVSALTRVEFLLSSIILFICTYLLILSKDKIKFVISYFCIYFGVVLTLYLNGSLTYMYQQLFQALFDNGENSVSLPSTSTIFKWIIVLIFTSIMIILISHFFHKNLAIIILYSIFLFSSHMLYSNVKNRPGKFFSFLELVTREIILVPIPLIIVYIICQLVKKSPNHIRYIKNRNINNKDNSLSFLPIYALCATSLLQVHNLSFGYMHFVLPIFLIAFSISYENYTVIPSSRSNMLNLTKIKEIIFVLTVLLSLTNFSVAATKDSQEFSAPNLKFMKTYDTYSFDNINEITLFLSKVKKNEKIVNNCPYALYSVNQNGYIANSRYPWNLLSAKQKNIKDLSDAKSLPDYYLVCSSALDSAKALPLSNLSYQEVKKYFISNEVSLIIYRRRN